MKESLEHSVTIDSDQLSDDLDNLILKRIKLLSMRRISWLRKIWTDVSENKNSEFNAHTEIDGYLSDRDSPVLEKEWYENTAEMLQISYTLDEVEKKISENYSSRLNHLVHIFGLNRLEADIIQICFAISIDPNLSRVFAYLQDHSARGYVTESLVARLFGYGRSIISPAGTPLRLWGMIREINSQNGEPTRIECDPFIKNWLLGSNEIDGSLISILELIPVRQQLSNWPVRKVTSAISRILDSNQKNNVRIFIEGTGGSGRKSFAAIISNEFKSPLLAIDSDGVPESDWNKTYMLIQRQAFLSSAFILWYGKNIHKNFWPTYIPSVSLQFITGSTKDSIPANHNFLDLRTAIPSIPLGERLTLWHKFAPYSKAWEKKEFEELALSYESTISQIKTAGQKMPRSITAAYKALKEDSVHKLGKLAQQMPSTFTFEDLVLPDYTKNTIEDFLYEATERIPFWEQPHAKRLYPQGRGLIGLFTGSPGTGKTMAAQVIASTLKLDLFRIDLSNVISKYVGESSKNIEQILTTAKTMNIVLLFDEADSLFGKRTEIKDAHDRYANTETNYLLQAIETYPGIVILASNKRSNIDNSFTRRLRYILEFSKPDASQRLSIWRKIIGEMTNKNTLARLNGDLERLSSMTEVTGAQIKQAVLSSLFIARKEKSDMKISYILEGLARELTKDGRGLGKDVRQNFKHNYDQD